MNLDNNTEKKKKADDSPVDNVSKKSDKSGENKELTFD